MHSHASQHGSRESQEEMKRGMVCVREGGKILLKQKISSLFCEDGLLFLLVPVKRDEMEEEEERER